ncbi:hypothetical protein ABFS82_14G202600 [Erythranthe guttata]|uniref:Single-stranded DNA-binding protein n=1 Tax=Erythranthe guttata TaxID=4155 RepID=A0A022PQZ4_ERYGU|nr:PREDICTED: protein OSB2, chloroplastic-like [Erythranthe guttata]EYU17894.1 hypothetical protein MIMGU_mgv1a010500mg [Erythranthe guttata]|eukprot:XP_012829017.1 PREDICTED: protein OSB2, chloroplastic-like [Erythranthe guttata]
MAMAMAALDQTLALKNTVLIYQNPSPISCFPFLSLNSKSLTTLASTARVKCSFGYNSGGTATNTSNNGPYEYERYASSGPPQFPRPAEIQWKKELCNTIQLIGVVGAPVQIKHLPSGKVLAWSRLAVKKSQTDTLWINLTFWDELAQVAFQHVEKGQQVYVSGRLVSDTVESDEGKQQTYYKVTVQQLNFIERGLSSVPLYNGDSNSVAPSKKQNNYSTANSTGTVEELWQAFFANPTEWWDNRKNKRSPNYPDFKHKDTGEALWVEGRNNPSWVKSQLGVLDSKMESFHEQNSSMHANFMSSTDSLGSF